MNNLLKLQKSFCSYNLKPIAQFYKENGYAILENYIPHNMIDAI